MSECGLYQGKSDEEQFHFGFYVVALIDLLGQSRKLAKWSSLPMKDNSKEWLAAVRRSMGEVMLWREEFDERFRQYDVAGKLDKQNFPSVSAEEWQKFCKFCETTLCHHHFSDTLIFYSPIENRHGYFQVANIVKILGVCAPLFLGALAVETPLRGAIDVGMLSHLPTGDPYGPVLASVHHLESEGADFPRILIGDGLLSYLKCVEQDADTSREAQANRSVVSICRNYIARSSDGCWFLDYLSESFTDCSNDPEDWNNTKMKAHEFVQHELKRFRTAGDSKLVQRYEALDAYFRSRGLG